MSENEYQEKIDALEALLDEWENKESSPDGYINHQAHVFIRDGIVHEKPEKWYRQKYRPLFLLREAYGGDQGWDIRAYVRSVADRERKDRSWPTWYNVTRWAYGILKTSANGDFPSLPDNSIITTKSDDHPLKQIAVVNIKKSNGQKTSKLGDLMNYAKYDATEIWQEIELIDPTVIISANDPLIQDELAKKKGFEIDRQDFPSILKINGHDVILIEYHHPADFHYTNMTNYCKLMAMYQRAFRAIKNK